jgi:DNA-binding response OmpR family regulator
MARILVAEDERDIRELIEFSLRLADFEVVLTHNGEEAIEKASIEKPDLILLDVRMPRMSGYETCRRLKEDPSTSEIPVVFLSAKGQEKEIEEGLDSGALEYIVKPFAPDELAEQVWDILRRARAV